MYFGPPARTPAGASAIRTIASQASGGAGKRKWAGTEFSRIGDLSALPGGLRETKGIRRL